MFEETAKKNEKVDGRLMMFLLSNPVNDGGQWDMLVNLIKKHGLIPKKCWKESSCSESSRDFNKILNNKVALFVYYSLRRRHLTMFFTCYYHVIAYI